MPQPNRARRKTAKPRPRAYVIVVKNARSVAEAKGHRGPHRSKMPLAPVLEISRTSRLALSNTPTSGNAIPRLAASSGKML